MYFCSDHGIEYGEDGFMCLECGREIDLEEYYQECHEHQQERYPDQRGL